MTQKWETDRWSKLEKLQDDWESGRPSMAINNKDLLTLGILLEGEQQEVSHALIDFIAEPVDANKKELAQELADVFLFLFQIARNAGIDFFCEIVDKMAYNVTRYTSGNFFDDYVEGRDKSRKWVAERNWKQQYNE